MQRVSSRVALLEADVRALVRLLADVAASRDGHAGKRALVLQGLAELIDADFWLWLLLKRILREQDNGPPAALAWGTPQRGEAGFRPRLLDAVVSHVTLAGSAGELEKVSAGRWPAIHEQRKVSPRTQGMIWLGRSSGRRPFNSREHRIARIVLKEIPRLYEEDWQDEQGLQEAAFSPRQRLPFAALMRERPRMFGESQMRAVFPTLGGRG